MMHAENIADGVSDAPVYCTFATTCRDGSPIYVRPLRAEDRELERKFIASLSETTRFFRMLAPLRHLPPDLLDRFMDLDGNRRMALVATTRKNGKARFIGVARYGATDREGEAEVGVTVTDEWQRQGVAMLLMETLIRCAAERGFQRLVGWVLPENFRMLALARRLGFHIRFEPGEKLFRIEKTLASAGDDAS
jgi:RimJ/RimL family protein N-acetyltransferase